MAYMPVVLLLNDYFPDKFIMLNTIALFGSTAGAMVLPVITERAFEAYGYEGAFVILGGIVLNVVVCGAAVRKPQISGCRQATKGCDDAAEDNQMSVDCEVGRCDSDDRTAHESTQGIAYKVEEDVCNDAEDETGNEQAFVTLERQNRIANVQNECSPLIQDHPESDDNCGAPGSSSSESSQEETRHTSSIVRAFRKTFPFQEPIFSFTLPINFFFFYVLYAWMLFLVPNAEQRGIGRSEAVLLSTIAGVGGVAGRLIFIVLLAFKFNTFIIYIVAGVVCSATFFLDFAGSGYAIRAVLALLQGVCFFIEDTCSLVFAKELVKNEANFSFAISLTTFLGGVGAIAAGLLTGTCTLQGRVQDFH